MKQKSLAVLGCTGSIGTQTLDVVRRYPDRFCIRALVCNKDIQTLAKQAEEFKPSYIGICDEEAYGQFSVSYPCTIECGPESLKTAASLNEVDTVVCAVVGMAGLPGVVSAISARKTVALANKESLVCAGELLTKLASKNGVAILPVDSEHSAVWQCLQAGKQDQVDQIILTASGGPFRNYTDFNQFRSVTVEQAIAHPNWKMGKKISVDSATMMNKGLEIIEARWLFDCKNIEYVLHFESIIHSMVRFKDGAVIAQMSQPTMELPIQLALTYPDRLPTVTPPFVFDKPLTFRKPNEELFFLPRLAKDSVCVGKSASCALNAANEAAVKLFLERKIGFDGIFTLVRSFYESYQAVEVTKISDVYSIFDDIYSKISYDYANYLRS